jgi:prephenate dehydratase
MTQVTTTQTGKIAFQGAHGAFSDMSCRAVFPNMETIPHETFEDAFRAVETGETDLAMIPVDNSLAGRVADVHHLLPTKNLFIIGEHFQPISMCLLGVKGSKISDITDVHSHVHAIPQCRKVIKELHLKTHIHADTAGAAKEIADKNDKSQSAIASRLAGEMYGLEILKEGIQDIPNNTTRFLILSREPEQPDPKTGAIITSFFFEVRNVPAALYKAMGGFATNNVQITKLESYIDPQFHIARFYAEVLGGQTDLPLQNAFEELKFFAKDFKIMGGYLAHPFRHLNS